MSAYAIQYRRGSTADHATFTGLNGEVTYDTTLQTLRVHDGVTVGGWPIGGGAGTFTSLDVTGPFTSLGIDDDATGTQLVIGDALTQINNPLTVLGAFTSPGIDDNATSTQLTVTDALTTVDNNLTVTGDLTVEGTTTIVNTETIALADNILELNSNAPAAPATEDAGLEVNRGTDPAVSLIWDETNDKWTVGSETFVAGTIEVGSVDIDSGTIDGTIIGATTPAAATVTDFVSTGITDTATTSTQMTLTDTEASFANNVTVTGNFDSLGIDDNATTTKVTVTDALTTLDNNVTVTGNFDSLGIDDNATTTKVTVTDALTTLDNNVTVTGDLTVTGTTTTVNTETIALADNIIELNSNAAGAATEDAGIEVNRGTDPAVSLIWDETNDFWTTGTESFDTDGFILGGSTALTSVDTDLNAVSAAHDTLTTSLAVKTYVDAQVTASDLDFQADTGGALAIDLDSETMTYTGGYGVNTTGAVNAVTFAIDLTQTADLTTAQTLTNKTMTSPVINSGDINTPDIDGGNIDGTIIGATTSAAATFSNMTSDSVDVNGGNVDGTVIGATTSAAGTFSTLATDSVDINGGDIDSVTIDGSAIGGTTSAAGTFSNMTSDSVDVNGGNVDGTIIGATTPAAATTTALTANTSFVLAGSAALTSVDTDLGAVSASHDTLATAKATKDYVDAQLTASDLDFQADTGGALAIDLDSETITFTGGTGIDTTGAGNTVTFAIDSTVTTLTGTQTLTNKTMTSPVINSGDINTPDIDGGTVDGTIIGATTPAAATVTDFVSTGITDTATTSTQLTLTDTQATFANDVTVTGDLTVSGTTTTVNTEEINLADNTILLNSNAIGAATEDAGIEIERGTDANVSFLWDETNDFWTTGTETFDTDGFILGGSTALTSVDTDLSAVSAAHDTLTTAKATKDYVDAQLTASGLDFQADTGGALAIDLDSETMTFTGGTGIDTSGAGNAVTFAIDNTVVTLTGTQTLTNKTLTSPDINTPDIDGGNIDGAIIGATTSAAGTFSNMTSDSVDVNGGNVDGTTIGATTPAAATTTALTANTSFVLNGSTALTSVDTDLSTVSASHDTLPTTLAVKTYVDSSIGDGVFVLEGEEATLATVTETAIASFDATVYVGGKFIITSSDTVSGDRQIVEILVTHDGTTAVSTEYAIVDTAGSIATFDVSLSGSTVSILATNASANSTDHKIAETLMTI